MKRKVISYVTVMALLVGTFPINAFAAENTLSDYDKMIVNIVENSDENSGVYFKDNILHIVPTEGKGDTLSTTLYNTRNSGVEYIIDNPAKYTADELQTAFLTLRANRDDLDITSYTVNFENNGIIVSAADWTEEEKEEIANLLGIENIEFISEGNDVKFDEYDELANETAEVDNLSDNSFNTMSNNATYKAKLGYRMNWEANSDINYTIGRAVEDSRGNIYFVTAGHGLATDDEMYLETVTDSDSGTYINGLMGTVEEALAEGDIDAALVASNDAFLPTTITRENVYVEDDGTPYEGSISTVWTCRGPVFVKITSTGVDVMWEGNWMENMIEMSYGSTTTTGGGDSGACISILWNNDYTQQRYIGIYKGRKELADGSMRIYGTNRTVIEDRYNVSSYQE